MKPASTDKNLLPHQYRNLVPLTGLTATQVHIVCAQTRHRVSPHPARPLGFAAASSGVLLLIPLRTNPTTGGLAALFDTSQSAVDPIIRHRVGVLAHSLRPRPDDDRGPWIIDATLIPVHDQSITAISTNFRRSVSAQIIICAHRRRVAAVGRGAGPATATTSSSPAHCRAPTRWPRRSR